MNVLKHDGAGVPVPWNAFVRSIPPSKKSGGTILFRPIPPVASADSHGEIRLVLNGFAPELVVAHIVSVPDWFLQSPAVPICTSGLAPPTQRYAVMLLTPPPFVNSETTSTSLMTCLPVKLGCPLGAVQL